MSTDTPGREPLLTVGTATTAVAAGLALLVSFGLPISDDQQAAVLGLIAAAAPLVAAFAARGRVTPVASPQDNRGRPLVPGPAFRD